MPAAWRDPVVDFPFSSVRDAACPPPETSFRNLPSACYAIPYHCTEGHLQGGGMPAPSCYQPGFEPSSFSLPGGPLHCSNRNNDHVQHVATDIGKLQETAKLFRLLPLKTQTLLKQLHPRGPLNSDIFAAVMAATDYSASLSVPAYSSRESEDHPTLDAKRLVQPAGQALVSDPVQSESKLMKILSTWPPSEEAPPAESMIRRPSPSPILTSAQMRLASANIPADGLGAQTHGPPGANVFVFHIPNEWVEQDLAFHFAQFGPILSARIATDKGSGRRRGFGFVSFAAVADAQRAVAALHGFSVAGKRLKVTIKRGEQQLAGSQRSSSTSSVQPSLSPKRADSVPQEENRSAAETLKSTTIGNDDSSVRASTWGELRRPPSSQWCRSSETSSRRMPYGGDYGLAGDYNCCQGISHCNVGSRETLWRESVPSSRTRCCAALRRLQVVGDILSRVYDRLSASGQPMLPDEAWLDILTNLLRTEPGRHFIFTLLMAVGVSLENSCLS
eukprot:Gregarina_sp_Poly_1__3718@NODE_209_length_11372_cov_428_789120_g186_i0_p4_GENE_NODE_209_length_11372_cov_428_789120_g186_i0NODE_209_length_11372_cov_428_789120_g186_i0_p4_ORF_typecomplete_len503_score73_26RRM_1/PF00076_22/2e18RRM_5/PF13893_6/0_00032Limkainb1/PF11608_8/0_0022Nup35_RRM_2/PF14605_6/0_01RNA_bind/PF08675_11/0_019RRM_7/PF16367_5/0_058_NODE_209_length_11372_cov_428_789120_g186_i0954911057